MEAIIEAFENLIEFISTIFNFISNIIAGLIMHIRIVSRLLSVTFQEMVILPNWLYSIAYITIGITLLMILVNRRKGQS